MLSLETSAPPWSYRPMARGPSDPELDHRRQYAAVIRAIREEKELSQEDCAGAIEQTVQSWQNYEWAKRRFTPRLIALVAKGLGVDVETIEMRRAALFPPSASRSMAAGVQEGEREYLRATLSTGAGYRIVTEGDIGPKEVGDIIVMLEAQKAVLERR
jgi:transcriptional regulator with XRE-family HTH domain